MLLVAHYIRLSRANARTQEQVEEAHLFNLKKTFTRLQLNTGSNYFSKKKNVTAQTCLERFDDSRGRRTGGIGADGVEFDETYMIGLHL